MTGKNMIIVAVLLANSVKQATNPVINITAAAGGTSARGWRWPPIQEASPDSCQTPQEWGYGSKIKLQHDKTKQHQTRVEPHMPAGQKREEIHDIHKCKVEDHILHSAQLQQIKQNLNRSLWLFWSTYSLSCQQLAKVRGLIKRPPNSTITNELNLFCLTWIKVKVGATQVVPMRSSCCYEVIVQHITPSKRKKNPVLVFPVCWDKKHLFILQNRHDG